MEINTYVKDSKTGNYGTLNLDYLSNDLSMDPINLFKPKSSISYINNGLDTINVDSISINENIKLSLKAIPEITTDCAISNELIKYSDYIYYKNGIYDKLFYDSTLVEGAIRQISPVVLEKFKFNYKDLIFEEIDSIFFFENKINFVGGMWENL